MNHKAEIKVKTTVKCSYWNPWNALTRMHRRIKDAFCILMDSMAEGAYILQKYSCSNNREHLEQ